MGICIWAVANWNSQMGTDKWALANGNCQVGIGKWASADDNCLVGIGICAMAAYALRHIKVGVGKGYDGHVVKGISKTAIFEKNDALPS